jgi:hypothetical protein
MGFLISSYQLYGLPVVVPIYVSIHGSYAVKKESLLNCYNISFTVYFQASQNSPVITQKDMSFNIQALPSPANLYIEIYNYIKGQLDPYYLSNNQTLEFTDD